MRLWTPELIRERSEIQRGMRRIRRHGCRGMDTPTMRQVSSIWRDDDNDEINATNLELKNAPHTITMGSGDTKIRLRIEVDETAGNAMSNFMEQWRVQKNATGGYVALPAVGLGTGIEQTTSTHYTDGDDTTQQLGAGSFLGTNSGMTQADFEGSAMVPDYAGSDTAEFEIVLNVIDADVADADFFDFRIYEGGVVIDVYAQTPRLTISKAAGAATPYYYRRRRRLLGSR